MKTCTKCLEPKPLGEFYTKASTCKVCYRARVNAYRKDNIEAVRAYDKERSKRPERKAHIARVVRRMRDNFPKKQLAHSRVAHAVLAGKLKPGPCEVCGVARTVGHHDDYDRPLDVRWLCQAHHVAWHQQNGEGANAA